MNSNAEDEEKVIRHPFTSGNPSIEIFSGIIHLYKRIESPPDKEDCQDLNLPPTRSPLVCVLCVPSYLTISDFIHFIAQDENTIENMRILRNSSNHGKYMIVMKFREQSLADQFVMAYHGTPFNALNSEVCSVLFIDRVEFYPSKEDVDADDDLFPLPNSIELPTCPVCLERMDSHVSGLLTNLCNHNFHSKCISQWGETGCPVCRYHQGATMDDENSRCTLCTCNDPPSLWICLLCGHVGCGRFQNSHAIDHYDHSGHSFALNLDTQRVWDYTNDTYVHRIIQNKSDGKLVPVDQEKDEKIASMEAEFAHLLTTQIQTFQAEISQLKASYKRKQQLNFDLIIATTQEMSLIQEELRYIKKERTKHEKTVQRLTKNYDKSEHEVSILKQLNSGILQRSKDAESKLSQKDSEIELRNQEIKDLKAENQDLVTHLSGMEQIQHLESGIQKELKEGRVIVPPPPPPPKKKKKRKKKV